ncbi:hypothetical protein AVEN_108264-1 [Araneus ventricosus]|uniref:Uncharacterized protein n=1 Tax=Araneus ventricosus TaxID=182803 RepID=A0A4Y2DXM0_ARAVE|nr:hypothetical protein AVEN_108264-1 [Araneus ventricosus]
MLAPIHEKLAKRLPGYNIYHVTVRHWVPHLAIFRPKKFKFGVVHLSPSWRQIMKNSPNVCHVTVRRLSGENLSDDEIIPPSFNDSTDSIGKLRTYFFCQKNSDSRQTTVKDFLN